MAARLHKRNSSPGVRRKVVQHIGTLVPSVPPENPTELVVVPGVCPSVMDDGNARPVTTTTAPDRHHPAQRPGHAEMLHRAMGWG